MSSVEEIIQAFDKVHSGDCAPEDRVRSLGWAMGKLTELIQSRFNDIEYQLMNLEKQDRNR